jgi:hypothetical protein
VTARSSLARGPRRRATERGHHDRTAASIRADAGTVAGQLVGVLEPDRKVLGVTVPEV